MIKLKVIKKLYKKGSDWEKLSYEADNYFFCSKDLEDDSDCPVHETLPGRFNLAEDFECYFYNVDGTLEDDQEYAILESLRDFRFYDSSELRFWFKDIEEGTYQLNTHWEEVDVEETGIAFDSVERIK